MGKKAYEVVNKCFQVFRLTNMVDYVDEYIYKSLISVLSIPFPKQHENTPFLHSLFVKMSLHI